VRTFCIHGHFVSMDVLSKGRFVEKDVMWKDVLWMDVLWKDVSWKDVLY
jgi:hypothetical protein